MQNENTLIELGFIKNEEGEYFYTGKNKRFIALVTECNGPVYIELFLVSDKIDNRPLSDKFGKPLKQRIKDCCSSGSVERAIQKFDI